MSRAEHCQPPYRGVDGNSRELMSTVHAHSSTVHRSATPRAASGRQTSRSGHPISGVVRRMSPCILRICKVPEGGAGRSSLSLS